AAHVFHDVAATAIQNGARWYFDRKATFWFPERQQFFAFQLKKRVFRAWRGRAQQLHHQRMLVYRKFIAWRHHVVLAARYREMYRICFWPLYVWKRYVQFVLLSRSKSMFLRLVFHTYVQLRILRGWRRYGTVELVLSFYPNNLDDSCAESPNLYRSILLCTECCMYKGSSVVVMGDMSH
ncbi:hypothetical protein AaE_011449, partial [Aphanomyces astaci]